MAPKKSSNSKITYRPGVPKLLGPLLVHLLLGLPLQGRQPHVEAGQAHRGEQGLVHGNFGEQVLHVVLGKHSRGKLEPVVHQRGVAESPVNQVPGSVCIDSLLLGLFLCRK